MGSALQPFLISEFKTGINTYMQPWIRPADAFEPLTNAYIYRGTVNKRAGYSQFGNNVPKALIITNITQAANAVVTSDNTFTSDDYGVTTIIFYEVAGMTEINGLTGTLVSATGTTFTVNIDSTAFTAYTSGGIAFTVLVSGLGDPIMGIMRYVDEGTGAQSLVIATTTSLFLYDPGTGDFNPVTNPPVFTGNITNFFNWTNWQAITGATSYMYFANNNDTIGRFDGAAYTSLVPVINGAGTTITTCLDTVVYKQRLLLIRPTLSSGGIQNQSIYWSAVQNPSLWRVDIAGQGGSLDAPTGDIIQSVEFLRDVLVVFFTYSTWIFRYTGNDSAPFRWDKANNSKSTNCPYASVAYDERATAQGNTGFIACDGVNVQRYDINIIDYYQTNISEQYYSQSFSQRYDNLNQSWTLYVSNGSDPVNFPLIGGVAPGSDSALVYNFLENTWATYTWSIPLTCLGIYYNQTGTTWQQLNVTPEDEWQNMQETWNSYTNQKGAPILLAGDTTGHVYHMDNGQKLDDNGTPINVDIVTTRWNPIMTMGQKVQFAYIDIYYRIISYPDDPTPISVTLDFYVDNTTDTEPTTTRTLTLDGPVGSGYAFKRVYINIIGEFIQMEIDPDENANLQFVGFIIWARPAGRLTPF